MSMKGKVRKAEEKVGGKDEYERRAVGLYNIF